jgi:hypothetical protein
VVFISKCARALTSQSLWQAGALLLAAATWSVSPSLLPSLPHSLTHSLTHSFTHSLTHALHHSLIQRHFRWPQPRGLCLTPSHPPSHPPSLPPSLPRSRTHPLPICSAHIHLCTPYVSLCHTHMHTHAHTCTHMQTGSDTALASTDTHTHTHTHMPLSECRRSPLFAFCLEKQNPLLVCKKDAALVCRRSRLFARAHTHTHTHTHTHRCRRRSRVRRRSGFSTALLRYMSKETYYRTKCQKRPTIELNDKRDLQEEKRVFFNTEVIMKRDLLQN